MCALPPQPTRYYERYCTGRGELEWQNSGPWALRKVHEGAQEGQTALQQREEKAESGYMIEVINHFGHIGGFESIKNRINSGKDAIGTVQQMLTALSCAAPHISRTFGESFMDELDPLGMYKRYIDAVTDAELKTMVSGV
jgi:hypothetical protein